MSYSEEDAAVASEIVSGYFEGRSVDSFERRYGPELFTEYDEELPLFDIERDVEVFSAEAEFADHNELPILCLPLGADGDRIVPVSFEEVLGPPPDRRAEYPSKLERHTTVRELERMYYQNDSLAYFETRGPYIPVSVERARDSFISLATEFLATRISSLRQYYDRRFGIGDNGDEPILKLSRPSGGPPLITPGCTFQVTTNSYGLRVHWSGAYYIAPNYFNSPTSPVSRALQSGTYIFGIDGGMYPTIQWDTTAIVSLPGSPSLHLNY